MRQNKHEKDEEVFFRAYSVVNNNYAYEYFCKRLADQKFRRDVVLSLSRRSKLLREKGKGDAALRLDYLKIDFCSYWDERDAPEESALHEPVQSYLNECPVRLRKNRIASLSYYDNRRSREYTDRYYFGIYEKD